MIKLIAQSENPPQLRRILASNEIVFWERNTFTHVFNTPIRPHFSHTTSPSFRPNLPPQSKQKPNKKAKSNKSAGAYCAKTPNSHKHPLANDLKKKNIVQNNKTAKQRHKNRKKGNSREKSP